MRDVISDAQKALLSMLAGLAGVPLILIAAGLIGYCAGRPSKSDAKIAAIEAEKRTADSVVIVRTDTITKVRWRVDTVRARSDALDSAVVIWNDSTVIVHDSVAVIPPLVVADLRALRLTVATQDTLILHLYQRDTTRLWQIASRDKLIRELSRRRPFACGRKCGLVIGLAAGISLHKLSR